MRLPRRTSRIADLALSLFDCAISVIAGSVPFAVIELTKVIRTTARRA
jgi:hypothetical protein